jgi:small subunit ribosomal protein S8
MTDPIADMLTRLRNAQAVKKEEIVLPYSNIKYEILKLLAREEYVESVERVTEKVHPELKVVLKYKEDRKPFIEHIKRISKPGQRIYISKDKLPRILNDFGLAILSTSQGIMTNKKARRVKIGGELLFEIW